MIEANGLTKKYSRNGTLFAAVDQVSLSLPKTGFIAIEGESGAGKSTLLHLLALLDFPDEGNISYNGLIISEQNRDEIRNNFVSFVPQQFGLIEDLTVEENLSFLNVPGDRVRSVLKEVGLEGKDSTPVYRLSGGEKKRVAIARCILQNKACLFMDEPTSDLDEENARNIFVLAKKISKTRLVVLTTHDCELASSYCDGFLLLSKGKVSGSSLQVIGREETNQPSRLQTKIPAKTIVSFLKNSLHGKISRFCGSLLASSLSICLFSTLFSVSNFQTEKAFESALIQSKSNFVPLYENLGGSNGYGKEWFPLRKNSINEVRQYFPNASAFAIGNEVNTGIPLFLFPYQSGMAIKGNPVPKLNHGECVCSSYLFEKTGRNLVAQIQSDFFSSSLSLSIASTIPTAKPAPEQSSFADASSYFQTLAQDWSYIIVNEEEFAQAFALSNPASLPAANFFANATLPDDRYYSERTKYTQYESETIVYGDTPTRSGEVVVSSDFLSRQSLAISDSEIIGKNFSFRSFSPTDTGSPFFRKTIDVSLLFPSITIVGISKSSRSDIFLGEEDAILLSEELPYYSGGVAAFNENPQALSTSLSTYKFVSSLPSLSAVYQIKSFSRSPVCAIVFVGSILALFLSLLTTTTYCHSMFDFRRSSIAVLELIGVQRAQQLFLLFLLGASLPCVALPSGLLIASLALYLLNLALFDGIIIFHYSFACIFIVSALLLTGVFLWAVLWLSSIKKKPLTLLFAE